MKKTFCSRNYNCVLKIHVGFHISKTSSAWPSSKPELRVEEEGRICRRGISSLRRWAPTSSHLGEISQKPNKNHFCFYFLENFSEGKV